MTQLRTVLLRSGLLLALCGGAALAQSAGKPLLTLQMPALPDPVRVALPAAKTALLVLDYVDPICGRQPKCKDEMLPALTRFMAGARKAGVIVAYGTRAPNMSKWLPDVAPTPGDIKIANVAQDRFYNTDLDNALKAKGIATVIISGWKVSGSVVYTSVGATVRGYTTVIPVDTTAASTDWETTIGFFQILNQNPNNLKNEPLKPKSATLTRTDMIAFQ
ncbi:MAG TPA: isochorismatase family protein [Xanthobacteraceae bacterium]|jgi:nicotinamidase-related amidase